MNKICASIEQSKIMIDEEVYVSFEVAKLLKEKGFDWRCVGYYVNDEPDDIKYSSLRERNSDWESRCCSAPTHQIAIAWIVEKYNTFIEVSVLKHNCWVYTIYKILSNKVEELYNDGEFKSREEAVESALKYYLTNLI